MARPLKNGLDYFPLDVDFDQQDEMQILQAKCGMEGFATYVKLLMRLFKNSYYTHWNQRETLIFTKRNSVEDNVVNNVIDICISENIFDKDLYQKYRILTSGNIQETYFEACVRRKKVPYISEYLLINIEQYTNLLESEEKPKNLPEDIQEENNINSTDEQLNEINADINQSEEQVKNNQAKPKENVSKKEKRKFSELIIQKCEWKLEQYHCDYNYDWNRHTEYLVTELLRYICDHYRLDHVEDWNLFGYFSDFIDELPDLWMGDKPCLDTLFCDFEIIINEMDKKL